jgi:hypothetical protein
MGFCRRVSNSTWNKALGPRRAISGKRHLLGMGQKVLNMEVTVQYCIEHVIGMLAFRIGS